MVISLGLGNDTLRDYRIVDSVIAGGQSCFERAFATFTPTS
jgi:hypothetical protein